MLERSNAGLGAGKKDDVVNTKPKLLKLQQQNRTPDMSITANTGTNLAANVQIFPKLVFKALFQNPC